VLLQNTHFVEFPTVEIWDAGSFRGMTVDSQSGVTEEVDEERKPKRRKLDVKAAKKALSGLLGGYGSDEEEAEVVEKNVLDLLGSYAGSDDDEGVEVVLPEAEESDVEDLDDDTDDTMAPLDPAALLELMRQVQAVPEDDEVDWGDSGEDEPE
jgi:hypothetical protein